MKGTWVYNEVKPKGICWEGTASDYGVMTYEYGWAEETHHKVITNSSLAESKGEGGPITNIQVRLLALMFGIIPAIAFTPLLQGEILRCRADTYI